MCKGYIAVIDSGVGGLSVLKELINQMPNERFLYFGDNANAPYGNLSLDKLKERALSAVLEISKYKIRAVVLGCNTLSVTVFSYICQMINVPVFGVFPPVEQAIMSGEKTLLLATEKTAKFYHNIILSQKIYAKNLYIIGLKNLAIDIERNLSSLHNVNFEEHYISNNFMSILPQKNFFKRVILGCTHYSLIKNQIFSYFLPTSIHSGEVNTARVVKNYFKNIKTLDNIKGNNVLFVGKSAKINQYFWQNVVNVI